MIRRQDQKSCGKFSTEALKDGDYELYYELTSENSSNIIGPVKSKLTVLPDGTVQKHQEYFHPKSRLLWFKAGDFTSPKDKMVKYRVSWTVSDADKPGLVVHSVVICPKGSLSTA